MGGERRETLPGELLSHARARQRETVARHHSPYEVRAGKAYIGHASAGRAGWRAGTLTAAGTLPGWAGYSGDSEAGILSGISRKCRMRSGFY